MVLAVSAQEATRAKSPQVVSRAEVPEEGLEPTPTYVDWILNPARLPIPPLRRKREGISFTLYL